MDNVKNKFQESLSRITACPVHFLWDGRGQARKMVRLGFLGITLGLLLTVGTKIWPASFLQTVAEPVLIFGGLVWTYGQFKSFLLLYLTKKD